MEVINTQEASIIYENENVIGKLLRSENNIEFVSLKIEPNGKIDQHSLPIDVFFFVIRGQGQLFYDDEVISVSQNSLVKCNSGHQRGLKNNSNSKLELLAIKILS